MISSKLKEKLQIIPHKPGVYYFKNKNEKPVYVGKAKNLRNRVRSYFQNSRNLDPKTIVMVSHVVDVEYIITENEVEALILEANLIKEHKPRYNIDLKDDKSYPYIRVTNESYPQIFPTRKIVKDYRIHSKNSKNKINLALELLSYARNQVRMKPEFVLFDSWYSSKKILKRIKDYGWYFVTRLKKNRKFGNTSLIKYKTNPYWMAKDRLSCGLKVQIVRNGKQYFATNLMRLSKTEILNLYRIRQTIEEMNKLLKFCGLNDCQARKIKALNKHVQCTILALTLLEQESRRQGHSIYSLKKDNRLKEAYVQKLCETKLSLAA